MLRVLLEVFKFFRLCQTRHCRLPFDREVPACSNLEYIKNNNKHYKSTNLKSKYNFVPVEDAHSSLKELGHRLYQATLDSSSHQNPIQQISVAVQRGNAAAVLGSMGTDVEDLSNYFS